MKSSGIEAGREACKNSCIKQIVKVKLLSEFDNELDCVWVVFLSLRRFWCHLDSSLQEGVHFDIIQFP